MATMAASPAVFKPIADPSVYVVTWAFVSQIDCKLMFALIVCWGLRLPGIPLSDPCWTMALNLDWEGFP